MIRLKSANDGFLSFEEGQEITKEESGALQNGLVREWPYLDVFRNCLTPGYWYDLERGALYPIAGQTQTALSLTNNSLAEIDQAEVIEEEEPIKTTPKQRFWRLYLGSLVVGFVVAALGQQSSNQGFAFLAEIPFLMLVWITAATLMVGIGFYILWAMLHFSSSCFNWVQTGKFKSKL